MDAGRDFSPKRQFNAPTEQDIQNILDGIDKQNTKKATEGAMKALKDYMSQKQAGNLDDLTEQTLADTLLFLSITQTDQQGNRTICMSPILL